MKYITIILLILCNACSQPVWPAEEPIKFSVEINGVIRNDASQERIDKCDSVITGFTTRYGDMWYEQMEQCIYLDADYLSDEYIPTEEQL
jgi:hypothetical protein